MESKGKQNVSAGNLAAVSIIKEEVVYIAIKGSLHASDCSVFGLGLEEIKAIIQKYPGSGTSFGDAITLKTNVIHAINSLCQLGYKVLSSTGEAEITWTLQRDI